MLTYTTAHEKKLCTIRIPHDVTKEKESNCTMAALIYYRYVCVCFSLYGLIEGVLNLSLKSRICQAC